MEEVGHLGNPLAGKGGGRNKPPGRKGREGTGGEQGTGIFSFLTSGTPYLAYSFSLGAGVTPLIWPWESGGLEACGGHCRDSYPESLPPMTLSSGTDGESGI